MVFGVVFGLSCPIFGGGSSLGALLGALFGGHFFTFSLLSFLGSDWGCFSAGSLFSGVYPSLSCLPIWQFLGVIFTIMGHGGSFGRFLVSTSDFSLNFRMASLTNDFLPFL